MRRPLPPATMAAADGAVTPPGGFEEEEEGAAGGDVSPPRNVRRPALPSVGCAAVDDVWPVVCVGGCLKERGVEESRYIMGSA